MKYFLPKLKDNIRTPIPQPGSWKSDSEENLLKTLPMDLDIKGELGGEFVNSIPSVFARPLLFSYSLFNKDSPLHKYFLKEWRGILGLFCFKELENINLTIKEYNLQANNSILEKHIIDSCSTDFLNSLNPLNIVMVNDGIVAVSFPYCIFFTPAEYQCPDVIPWRENGRLSDPTEYFEENGDFTNLAYLYNWVVNIRHKYGQLQGLQEIFDRHRGNITDLLQNWEEEIENIFRKNNRTIFRGLSGIQYGRFEIREPYNYFAIYIRKESLPEERYFSKKIMKLSFNNNTSYNLNINGETYTFPVSKDYINEKIPQGEDFGEYIKRSVSFVREEVTPNTGRTIEIKIDLGEGYSISKKFTNKDIIEVTPTPILELWPSFKTEDWNLYYIFCDTNDRNFNIVPIINAQENKDIINRDNKEYKLTKFPDLILFTYCNEEAGVIIPKPEGIKTIDPQKSCIVGVDFGTSNTNVYIKEIINNQEIEPMPIKFKPSLLSLTNTDPTQRDLVLYQNFFPTKERIPDFPTLFRLKTQNQILNLISVLDGIVYMDPDIYSRWATSGLRDNIKWAENPEERMIISLYLEHLAMMIKEECRKRQIRSQNIEIRWAYPSLFRDSWKRDFVEAWERIYNSLELKVPYIQNNNNLIPTENILKNILENTPTENIAIVKYFEFMHRANIGGIDPHVFVDIGGGTTNISIWKENRLILQTSVKLAGNDIIGRYSENRDFLRLLLDTCIQDKNLTNTLINYILQNKVNPFTLINVVLSNSNYLKNLENNLFRLRAYNEFRNVNTLIYVFLAGIFYYIGLLLSYNYMNDKKLPNSISIWLAGKGSRMIDWLGVLDSFGIFVSEPLMSHINRDVNVEIELSSNPKSEVALGLTSNYKVQGAIDHVSILGEDIGDLFVWNKEMEKDVYKIKDEFDEISKLLKGLESFAYFDSFRSLLSKNSQKFGVNDISRILVDKNRVIHEFERYRNNLIKNLDNGEKPESFFIFELRVYLNEILNKYLGKNA